MSRLPSDNAANVLRSALAGPFPALRAVAARLIRTALANGPTIGDAAKSLGVSRRSLERLRAEYEEIDRPSK